MSGALSKAIEVEIAKRERRIEQVKPKLIQLRDEYKQLADELEQLRAMGASWKGGMPEKTPAIDYPPRESPVIDQRCEEIVACLATHGEMAPKLLAERLGISVATLREPLRRCVDAGRVVGEGATTRRTVRLADAWPAEPEPALPAAAELESRPFVDASGRLQIKKLREAVLRLIAENQGALDEQGLAYGTGADRDDVAEAVGQLLLDDIVVLHPDGTYSTNNVEAAA